MAPPRITYPVKPITKPKVKTTIISPGDQAKLKLFFILNRIIHKGFSRLSKNSVEITHYSRYKYVSAVFTGKYGYVSQY